MIDSPITLNLIGAGRLGSTLGRLWTQQGILKVQDVLTRSDRSAQAACAFIGAGRAVTDLQAMRPADLWLIATQDAHISQQAKALADALFGMPRSEKAVVFHCSGALGAQILAPLTERGWQIASAHPILSFASAELACQQFASTPVGLEGDEIATTQLMPIFQAIGGQCFSVRSEDKLLYHAAAVFATNFLPVLQSVAEQAWLDSGMPATLIPHLRQTLLHNAVHNITNLGPAGALTGPAARGDKAAMDRQAIAVDQWDPMAANAYRALAELALRMAKKGSA